MPICVYIYIKPVFVATVFILELMTKRNHYVLSLFFSVLALSSQIYSNHLIHKLIVERETWLGCRWVPHLSHLEFLLWFTLSLGQFGIC